MSKLLVTEFKVTPTAIPGLLEIDVSIVEDARGYFQEKFQREKLVSAGFPASFMPVQHSISYNKEAGVTRGFHAEPWDKYVGVIKGKVCGIYVDLRKGQNFGKSVVIMIDHTKAVFVPKGVANSFQTVESDTYYSYLVNDHWSPEKVAEYKSVNVADPQINAQWPISLDKAIISDKDKANPMLKDVIPFE